jgi:hypothetical protein
MKHTHGSLFLRRDFAHAQLPSKTSEHFLARLKFCAGITLSVCSGTEVALVGDRSSKSPSNKLLVKEREPGLLSPVGDDTIVTPKVPLSQPADVKVQLVQETLRAMAVISCSMACVSSEELISTQSGKQDTCTGSIWNGFFYPG